MALKRYQIQLAVICAVLLLLSLAGVAWDFTSRLLESGIDGIFLLCVALLMALVFAGLLAMIAKEAGLLPGLKKVAPVAAKPAAAASKPATEESK